MAKNNTNPRDKAVRQWANKNLPALKAAQKALGIKRYTGEMDDYLKVKYGKKPNFGINRIGYSMPRHAIFVSKGVGRGYPIGSVNTPSKALLGKSRKPKDWFNPTIEKTIPALADTLAEHDADIIANNLFIN